MLYIILHREKYIHKKRQLTCSEGETHLLKQNMASRATKKQHVKDLAF